MPDVLRRTARLVLLLAAEGSAVAVLHHLGSVPALAAPALPLDRWLAATAPADALLAVARLVALIAAWWLLASSLAYLVAVATRLPAAVRAVGWATLPSIRRLAERAAAATLVVGSVVGPGAAAVAQPPPTPVAADGGVWAPSPELLQPDAMPTVVATPISVPAAASEPAEGPAEEPAEGPAQPGAAANPAEEGIRVVVVPGDHLWGLVHTQLATAWERDPTVGEIAAHWRVTVAEVTPSLRSGDPDLVYPGERLVLPAAPEVGR